MLDGDTSPKKGGGSSLPTSRPMYCDKKAGWIKVPLGTKVGVGPGDIVLDESQLPPQKGAQPRNFRPMSVVAKRLVGSIGTEVGLGPGDIVLDGDPSSQKGGGDSSPHFLAHVL